MLHIHCRMASTIIGLRLRYVRSNEREDRPVYQVPTGIPTLDIKSGSVKTITPTIAGTAAAPAVGSAAAVGMLLSLLLLLLIMLFIVDYFGLLLNYPHPYTVLPSTINLTILLGILRTLRLQVTTGKT